MSRRSSASRVPEWVDESARPYLVDHAYLLAGSPTSDAPGKFSRAALAWRVFGRQPVDDAVGVPRRVLAGWGYRLGDERDKLLPTVVRRLLLLNRSPRLADWSSDLFGQPWAEGGLPAHQVRHAERRAAGCRLARPVSAARPWRQS